MTAVEVMLCPCDLINFEILLAETIFPVLSARKRIKLSRKTGLRILLRIMTSFSSTVFSTSC